MQHIIEFVELWTELHDKNLIEYIADDIAWNNTTSGEYSSSSADLAELNHPNDSFLKPVVWKFWAPPKHMTCSNNKGGQIVSYASYAKGNRRRHHIGCSCVDTQGTSRVTSRGGWGCNRWILMAGATSTQLKNDGKPAPWSSETTARGRVWLLYLCLYLGRYGVRGM